MKAAGTERTEGARGENHVGPDVARFRAQVTALATRLQPLAGGGLDGVWSGIDDLPDASVARALDAAEGIRRILEPTAARRPGLSVAGYVAAFGLGVATGFLLAGRGR